MRQYTEKEVVAFGNYLLSKEREENIDLKENKRRVHDVDLHNFKG